MWLFLQKLIQDNRNWIIKYWLLWTLMRGIHWWLEIPMHKPNDVGISSILWHDHARKCPWNYYQMNGHHLSERRHKLPGSRQWQVMWKYFDIKLTFETCLNWNIGPSSTWNTFQVSTFSFNCDLWHFEPVDIQPENVRHSQLTSPWTKLLSF